MKIWVQPDLWRQDPDAWAIDDRDGDLGYVPWLYFGAFGANQICLVVSNMAGLFSIFFHNIRDIMGCHPIKSLPSTWGAEVRCHTDLKQHHVGPPSTKSLSWVPHNSNNSG